MFVLCSRYTQVYDSNLHEREMGRRAENLVSRDSTTAKARTPLAGASRPLRRSSTAVPLISDSLAYGAPSVLSSATRSTASLSQHLHLREIADGKAIPFYPEEQSVGPATPPTHRGLE